MREGRRLELVEVVRGKHRARRLVNLRPKHHDRPGLGASEVEVAVLEAHFLADRDVLVDRERKRGRLVEDDDVLGDDLDLARWKVRVGAALGAQANRARHPQHILSAQGVRDLLADDHLGEPGPVSQVDEGDAPVIAATPHPPRERDGGASVGGTKVPCESGTKHEMSLVGVGIPGPV